MRILLFVFEVFPLGFPSVGWLSYIPGIYYYIKYTKYIIIFWQRISAVAFVFVSFKLFPLGFPSVLVYALKQNRRLQVVAVDFCFWKFSHRVFPLLVCILYVLAKSHLFLFRLSFSRWAFPLFFFML